MVEGVQQGPVLVGTFFTCERSALPACLLARVRRSVPWPGPPRERVKSVSQPRGSPSLACHSGPPEPRAPRASQRRPATAPSR